MKLILAITICLAAGVFAAAAEPPAAAPPPSPAVEEALTFLESGNYQACLRKISIQLSSGAGRPGTVDRYELLMLRGECLLRMRQPTLAAGAYDAAATSMKTSRDVGRVATANALATLCKGSPDLTYKAAGVAPIDIVDPESRRKALEAMYSDVAAKVTPEIVAALADKSLKNTNDLLPRAWELYSLEYVTTGEAKRTVDNLKQLGTHTRALLRADVDRLAAQVETLSANAGATTSPAGGEQPAPELAQITDEITRLQRIAQNGRRIARLLGSTGENWDELLADFTDVREAAQQAQRKQDGSASR